MYFLVLHSSFLATYSSALFRSSPNPPLLRWPPASGVCEEWGRGSVCVFLPYGPKSGPFQFPTCLGYEES